LHDRLLLFSAKIVHCQCTEKIQKIMIQTIVLMDSDSLLLTTLGAGQLSLDGQVSQ
jgi:hypothetical protein